MPIQYPTLTALDTSAVQSLLTEVASRLQERFPTLRVRSGGIHDSVIYPHALLEAGMQDLLGQYLRARSLQDLQQSPELADDALVDLVLSNWRITRAIAQRATGQIVVVLDSNISLTLAAGTVFSGGGQRYLLPTAISAKAEAELINTVTDRLIRPLADGNFAFTIPVEALVAGAAGNISAGTRLLPDQAPRNFVAAFAQSDFLGGQDAETNTELISRLDAGLATRSPSNRTTTRAMILAEETFAATSAISIIGMGDPEMHRDSRSIFPIHFGGRVDIYARTQATDAVRRTLTKTAVLVTKNQDGTSDWQISIAREDAPGFFEIVSIKEDDSEELASFEILEDLRGVDLSGLDAPPDIASPTEAAYSCFQTAIVRFRETRRDTTELPVGTALDYTVVVRMLPNIQEIQTLFSDVHSRHDAADHLVKAPVPCFLTVSLEISKQPLGLVPDLPALRTALAAVVNETPFVGQISASDLHAVAHRFLDPVAVVSQTHMLARIRRPDGEHLWLQDNNLLRVPYDPANYVSPRTVQFFLNPDDVGITIRNTVPATE